MRPTAPPPSSAAFCQCNYATQAEMNRKWLALTASPRIVDRVLCPRPARASPCATRKYEPPYTVRKQTAPLPPTHVHAAPDMSPPNTPAPSSHPLSSSHTSSASTSTQFADLVRTESCLMGHHRPSTYNYEPLVRTPQARSAHAVDGWVRGGAAMTGSGGGTGLRLRGCGGRCSDNKNTKENNNDTTSRTCVPRYGVPSTCVGGNANATCASVTYGSAQTRAPLSPNAPHVPNVHTVPHAEQRPLRSDEARGTTWRTGAMPYERAQCWAWGDHPFELDALGVARTDRKQISGGGCVQDVFDNSTRRKLLTGV